MATECLYRVFVIIKINAIILQTSHFVKTLSGSGNNSSKLGKTTNCYCTGLRITKLATEVKQLGSPKSILLELWHLLWWKVLAVERETERFFSKLMKVNTNWRTSTWSAKLCWRNSNIEPYMIVMVIGGLYFHRNVNQSCVKASANVEQASDNEKGKTKRLISWKQPQQYSLMCLFLIHEQVLERLTKCFPLNMILFTWSALSTMLEKGSFTDRQSLI